MYTPAPTDMVVRVLTVLDRNRQEQGAGRARGPGRTGPRCDFTHTFRKQGAWSGPRLQLHISPSYILVVPTAVSRWIYGFGVRTTLFVKLLLWDATSLSGVTLHHRVPHRKKPRLELQDDKTLFNSCRLRSTT